MALRSGALRDALGAIVVAVAAFGATLAIAEITARIVWLGHEPPGQTPLDPALKALPALETIEDLSRPNVRGRHGRALFRTNSAGFRGREYSELPAPGTFRIAIVGDSFAMGWMIAEEEIYASRLERALNAASAGARFEVLNLGLGGLNIGHVVRRLVRLGLRFHPDLIVYGFTVNDIFGPEDRRAGAEEQHAARAREWLRFADSRSYLLRMLWPRWVSLRGALSRDESSFEHSFEHAYADPAMWQRITAGLDALAELQRRGDACVHVLIHPEISRLRFFHPFTSIYARVARAAEERGLTATQAFPAFRWRNSAELRVGPLDGHPNAEGHRILAEILFAGLRALPAHCRVPPLGS